VAKLRLWIKNRILDPRFDMPKANMPRLGLDEADAASIAAKLTTSSTDDEWFDGVKRWLASQIPQPRQRHLLLFFGIGLVAGTALSAGFSRAAAGLRRRLRK